MRCFRKYILLLCMGIAVHFSSCMNCTCERVRILGMQFAHYTMADDSFATVDVHARGANFALPPISSNNIMVALDGKIAYTFDFAYDYRITVYPIGKSYTLSDLVQSEKPKKKTSFQCKDLYCATSYNLNGTVHNFPEAESTIAGGI